ncbi:TATA-binding protein-associated factor BTAF1 [Tanacetum coccineum]|uniref:TATA-binding protein-associated factor BTAF1 n=1 Tax=Tanacetum coccineum TaxID=301880 RepID=A0ABQ4Y9B7_9ASTR
MEDLRTMEKMKKMTGWQHLVEDGRWRRWTMEKMEGREMMKLVTYLLLDGSVQPEKSFGVLKSFNSDPTIDVFLLTTHVGGLGLNLTSAHTLVFMKHDWNPMRDLQAMDRAHRLGQRKVVNVHRLIMRGTLKEKGASTSKGSENNDGLSKVPGSGKGLKAILGGLEELWDQSYRRIQFKPVFSQVECLSGRDGNV